MPTANRGRFGAQYGGNAGDLREVNLTRILRYLRDHGTSSRHDIAAGVGLGISTMTDLVGELRARRLLLELPPVRRPTAGRPTRPIAIDGGPWLVLGVHVDVDKVEVSAASLGGEIAWSDAVSNDFRGAEGVDSVMDVLDQQLAKRPSDLRLCAVQVGVPGQVEPWSGTVTASVPLDWHDVALGDLVAQRIAGGQDSDAAPVRVGVANDTQLAGLQAARAELQLPLEAVAVYLGGSRSLAGSLIVDGEIFGGSAGDAGQLGHLNVDPAGELCWCGRRGCLETFAGLRWILQRSGLRSAEDAKQLAELHPRESSRVVQEAAEAGHSQVLEALDHAAYGLARSIDDIISLLSPDTVILGGQLGQLGAFLVPKIAEQMDGRLRRRALDLDPLVSVADSGPRVVLGATLAARDAVLADPLRLTQPLV